MSTVKINRAPVMTLWGSVVAERLGFDHDEALTLGRVLTGLNAHTKAVSLGLVEPAPQEIAKHRDAMKKGQTLHVDLMRRAVPVVRTPEGLRAVEKDKPVAPEGVEPYLKVKFGDALADARRAMGVLAKSMPPAQLASRAYGLYEQFRPQIPAGVTGWGAKGLLDLDKIAGLARSK